MLLLIQERNKRTRGNRKVARLIKHRYAMLSIKAGKRPPKDPAHFRFLCSRPQNKQFSIIVNPVFRKYSKEFACILKNQTERENVAACYSCKCTQSLFIRREV